MCEKNNVGTHNLNVENTRTNMFRRRKLLIFNTITSGFLMGAGDFIQQRIEIYRKIKTDYDWPRTGRMFTVGLFQGAPQHCFYLYLDRFLPGKNVRTISKKIVIDQLIASPFCIVLFFTGMGLMERKPFNSSVEDVKKYFPPIYLTDWCFWPPMQFMNFYYLPGHYRVVYVNSLTMLFNIFLSYMKHKD